MKKKINKNLTLYFTDNYPFMNKRRLNYKYTITLGIGGNIGDVKQRFDILFNMLKSNSKVHIQKTSPILKNPPFGYTKQDDFLNAIIKLQTNLSPSEVLRLCWHYENRLKRQRSFKNAARTLDIDIIFIYTTNRFLKINTKNLIVPHLGYKNRQSVLIPLKYV